MEWQRDRIRHWRQWSSACCMRHRYLSHSGPWADALIYATYVNNRMHNAGVNNIPYTLWTGKRANVKHLRTFGAHVSVKQSGHRPTKADPHYYNGRFLRFTATERNIVYFDTITGRDKTARHCRIDEFHYGTPNEERPNGAQQLLEAVFPTTTPNAQVQECIAETFEEQPHLPVPLDAIELAKEDDTPKTAATAVLLGDTQTQEILHLQTDSSMYGPPTTLCIPINRLPTLGLLLKEDTDTGQVFVRGCQEGTYCYRISRWRSTIRNSVLRSMDTHPIRTEEQQVKAFIIAARARRETHIHITFAKIEVRIDADDDIPQLHFDQLRHLNQLHTLIRQPMDESQDAFLNYTRAQLKKQPDYQDWRESEWRQNDKYKVQDMFGDPIKCPHGAIVLPFVWDYMTKEDPLTGILIRKSRGTYNGGKKLGNAVTIAETYATCVEQPACRLYWSTTSAECLIAMGADAGNAFAEAPAPTTPFFMRIDDQFREWWEEHCGLPPIPPGYVLPVNHALQDHP